MKKKIAMLWTKHEELFRYIIVGGLTTVLNAAVYWLLSGVFSLHYQLANAIAFVVAVVFAYIANKKAVFHTKTTDALDTAREAGSFFLMRLISYGVEAGLMALMVEVWRVDELLAKLPVIMLIVVLNYVFSKLYIFRKPKACKEEL